MKPITVRQALNACGGRYYGSEAALDEAITFACSDSRTVREGTLFVCYKGARVDGHDFMAACIEKGAACCLSEREPLNESETPCIVVPSTLRGVAAIAGFYRSLFDLPVIGITGSVGKTTAKEMIWAVLNQKYKTHKNRMNFNNEVSLPLMLLETPEDADAAIMEMGISDFGEMSRLAAMVRPTIAVITNIGDAHLEFLGDRSGVLKAKTEIFDFMQGEGLAIINGDDVHLSAYDCPVKKITFGLNHDNDFTVKDVQNLGGEGMRMTLCHHDQETPIEVPAFGAHLAYAVLMGAAVGWALGMDDEQIAAGVAAYETVGNRAKLISTGRFTILSDCYNANPNSTASAIDSLSTLAGRKICILGDMLELGENTRKLHAQTGAHAVRRGVDLVIGCGSLSSFTVDGAQAEGGKTLYFADKAQLIAKLPEIIREGDSVLVKASHSMAFEDIVSALEKM